MREISGIEELINACEMQKHLRELITDYVDNFCDKVLESDSAADYIYKKELGNIYFELDCNNIDGSTLCDLITDLKRKTGL